MSTRQLATQAVRAAARLRAAHHIGPADALCPYDLADQMGLIVHLVAASSMEGMYSPNPPPAILVTTERPPGRRRYTCAHEIGHHVFGHGTRLDELSDEENATWGSEEFVAHRFASGLLMPKLAVESAFARRGLSVATPTAGDVFVVAHDLGVGYATLVRHLERTLGRLSSGAANTLVRVSLPRLRSAIAGFPVEHDLVVLDDNWGQRPLDVEIGDIVLTPGTISLEGTCATIASEPAVHFRAVAPGIGAAVLDSRRRISLRVSRRDFAGLARFRHLGEVRDGE